MLSFTNVLFKWKYYMFIFQTRTVKITTHYSRKITVKKHTVEPNKEQTDKNVFHADFFLCLKISQTMINQKVIYRNRYKTSQQIFF